MKGTEAAILPRVGQAYRRERLVKDGIVKHLIITREPVPPSSNVWQPINEGGFAAVGYGVHFRIGRLPD